MYKPNTRLYIYSAYVESKYQGNDLSHSKITAIAWIHEPLRKRQVKCCILLHNSKLMSTNADIVMPWSIFFDEELIVVMYLCQPEVDLKHMKGVTLELTNHSCSLDTKVYVRPTATEVEHQGRIGQCAKLIYGNINGNRLIEWFEFQKLVGVKRIVAYPYEIKSLFALKVLEHYEKEGVLHMVKGFDFPEKGEFRNCQHGSFFHIPF